MVRESVTNVIRHSSARGCEIEVRGAAERVRLLITDDGGGDVGSNPAPGSGLTGLAERLAAAGGTLVSGPGPGGQGFRVAAELPVDEDPVPAAAAAGPDVDGYAYGNGDGS